MAAKELHIKCRNVNYPAAGVVQRFNVPDDKVPWNVPFESYNPTDYTSESVLKAPWADKFYMCVLVFLYDFNEGRVS